MSRSVRIAALLTVAAIAAGTAASVARADGDPASDYLLTQDVFLPFDAKFTPQKQRQFSQLVAAANNAGLDIRVALIATTYDLGVVTSLWDKPKTYARFLGAEIHFVYKQRLLVVMPSGFGFNWPGHSAAPAYAVLGKIPVGHGRDALLDAATTAVQKLAAAGGIKLVVAAPPHPHSRTHDRLIILAAAVGALLLVLAARFLLHRRRG
jgi:hypothetical protein